MVANLKIDPIQLDFLREMIESDLDYVMQGELSSYPFPWTRGNFEDCLANKAYSCWAFIKDDIISGHVVLSIVLKEAHILNICVYPSDQNQGWGRKLLAEAESIALNKGAETCFLEVRPSNKIGLNLYRSEAYNEIGVRKKYYPTEKGREDAIVMAKNLVLKFW